MITRYLVLSNGDISSFKESTDLLNQAYGMFGAYRTDKAIDKMRQTLKVMKL
jgi:hypothetical protein